MVKKRVFCRLLMGVSLSLYVISILQPWVVERYFNILLPEDRSFQFWSFQGVMGVVPDGNLSVFRFFEYWTPQTDGWHPYAYQGWLWFSVFVFQIIAVVAGVASMVRERVKGEALLPISSTTCLILTLILGYFQFVRQLELHREHFDILGITGSSINIDIGFHLTLISVILWTISLSFDQLVKAKTEWSGKGELNKAGVAVAILGFLFLIGGFLAFSYERILGVSTNSGPIVPYTVRPHMGFGIAIMGTGVALVVIGAVIILTEKPEREQPKDRDMHTNLSG
jgi:hypothetical protein